MAAFATKFLAKRNFHSAVRTIKLRPAFPAKLNTVWIPKLALWTFHFKRLFSDLVLWDQKLFRTNDKANKEMEMIRDSEPRRRNRFFFLWIEESE